MEMTMLLAVLISRYWRIQHVFKYANSMTWKAQIFGQKKTNPRLWADG